MATCVPGLFGLVVMPTCSAIRVQLKSGKRVQLQNRRAASKRSKRFLEKPFEPVSNPDDNIRG